MVAAAVCTAVWLVQVASAQTLPYALFERYLDALRLQAGIPGLSAAIVRAGQVEWERGFGRQDLDRLTPAQPDTPYPVGGLTQAFTATLLGMCAERGGLNIDVPLGSGSATFADPGVTVRHLLAHATDGVPPGIFRYDRGHYARLTPTADQCARRPFRVALADDILERLGMANSVPGVDLGDSSSAARALFEPARLARYADVLGRLAVPYRVDRAGRASRSEHADRAIDAASGLVSTVRDLARFDAALDAGVLLRAETLGVAWSPAQFGGDPLPTGLGWFVQAHQGQPLIWQFSHEPDAYSALILKLPVRQVTLILLANSGGLATNAGLELGDATTSPFVRIFLRLFA